eukprot:14370811-Alexandrium_andersonii.AAC.1
MPAGRVRAGRPDSAVGPPRRRAGRPASPARVCGRLHLAGPRGGRTHRRGGGRAPAHASGH